MMNDIAGKRRAAALLQSAAIKGDKTAIAGLRNMVNDLLDEIATDLKDDPTPKLSPGEAKAIDKVLTAGDRYGYGNMIAHLKRAWAELLISQKSLSVETAIKATDVPPYPLRFPKEGK